MHRGILIGIDHGLKRVGIAVSDENQEFAWPRPIIPTNLIHDTLKAMVAEMNVVGIVVGMPFMLDGIEGEQCKVVHAFLDDLRTYIDRDIFTVDERMSSRIVESLYNTTDDSYVAALILETFMQRRSWTQS